MDVDCTFSASGAGVPNSRETVDPKDIPEEHAVHVSAGMPVTFDAGPLSEYETRDLLRQTEREWDARSHGVDADTLRADAGSTCSTGAIYPIGKLDMYSALKQAMPMILCGMAQKQGMDARFDGKWCSQKTAAAAARQNAILDRLTSDIESLEQRMGDMGMFLCSFATLPADFAECHWDGPGKCMISGKDCDRRVVFSMNEA